MVHRKCHWRFSRLVFVLKISDAFIQSNLCQPFHPFDLTHSITMSFAVLHTFFFLMSLIVREFYLNTHYLQCLKNGHYTPERGNQCCSQFSTLCKWRLKSRTCPRYIAMSNNPTNHPTNWFSEPSGTVGLFVPRDTARGRAQGWLLSCPA